LRIPAGSRATRDAVYADATSAPSRLNPYVPAPEPRRGGYPQASKSGVECVGLEDSFDGLLEPNRSRVLGPREVTGILRLGGTILGTVNRGNPLGRAISTSEGTRDYSDRVIEMFHKMGLDALVAIGGDGTLAIAHKFCKLGIPIVGVPKTIDNDIVGTSNCFGFDTAVDFATDAIDRLHTTAEAHHRIMVVEVMGRYAGWIALFAGVAGGADAILIPEIPFDLGVVAERLRDRERGAPASASSWWLKGPSQMERRRSWRSKERTVSNGSGASAPKCVRDWRETGKETRSVVLGHLQRGGTPTASTGCWPRGSAGRPWARAAGRCRHDGG
jgi:6-phosphofructokinase 1